jgi:hypothetical protein
MVPLFQVVSQYTDDTTLFLRGEELYVSNAVDLFERFCSASGLLLNWSKSAAYWQHKNHARPPWTDQYQWTWVQPHELSRLLGSPLG